MQTLETIGVFGILITWLCLLTFSCALVWNGLFSSYYATVSKDIWELAWAASSTIHGCIGLKITKVLYDER